MDPLPIPFVSGIPLVVKVDDSSLKIALSRFRMHLNLDIELIESVVGNAMCISLFHHLLASA